jgi:hypothetical protein
MIPARRLQPRGALLTTNDINHERQTVQLGRRPVPTALDPATWAALQRCLTHRQQLATSNPT